MYKKLTAILMAGLIVFSTVYWAEESITEPESQTIETVETEPETIKNEVQIQEETPIQTETPVIETPTETQNNDTPPVQTEEIQSITEIQNPTEIQTDPPTEAETPIETEIPQTESESYYNETLPDDPNSNPGESTSATTNLNASYDDEDDDYYDDEEETEEETEEESPSAPTLITQVKIINVNFDVDHGRAPIYSAKVSSGNVKVIEERWDCSDGKENSSSGNIDGTEFYEFENGKKYSYRIRIKAKGKDYFSSQTEFRVNGVLLQNGTFNTGYTIYTSDIIFSGISTCTHDFITKTEEVTCTTDGHKYSQCKYCGMIKDETFTPALGHQYVYDDDTSREPTCEYSGYDLYICSRCEELKTVVKPPIGHHYVLDEDAGLPATCTGDGCNVYVCDREDCGDARVEYTAPLGHDYRLRVKKAATATSTGTYFYQCAREDCGDKKNNNTIFPYKKIKLGKSSYAFNGSPVKPSFKVYDSTGKVISPDYYTAYYYNNKKVGMGTLHITFSKMYSGTLSTTFKIVKGSQKISTTQSTYTIKKSDVAKKTASIATKAKAKTSLSYKSSKPKYVTASKGVVKVKKGTPKGTYTITIKAAGNSNFKPASKKIKIRVVK